MYFMLQDGLPGEGCKVQRPGRLAFNAALAGMLPSQLSPIFEPGCATNMTTATTKQVITQQPQEPIINFLSPRFAISLSVTERTLSIVIKLAVPVSLEPSVIRDNALDEYTEYCSSEGPFTPCDKPDPVRSTP